MIFSWNSCTKQDVVQNNIHSLREKILKDLKEVEAKLPFKASKEIENRSTSDKSVKIGNCVTPVEFIGDDFDINIEIYNIDGVLLYSKAHNFAPDFVELDFNPSRTGIFILRAYNKNNNITKKVFINK